MQRTHSVLSYAIHNLVAIGISSWTHWNFKCIWNFLHFTALSGGIIKWKHFPRYWPFVRGIHRSALNSPHKGQWRGALMFSLIWVWINGWVNNNEAGELRRHRAHYDVTVMGWHVTRVIRTILSGRPVPVYSIVNGLGCWCPGDAKSRGTSSLNIDLIFRD